jgi:lipopolysaccharide/colanic/teichoic acid biosynthesis glycosyltransferase
MLAGADKTGVISTSSNDKRITKIGRVIRKYKIDELMQLFNVLKNDMSFVGPRPNVRYDVELYTSEEKKILFTKPGITDFASIVFSDEGDILSNSANPNLDYNLLIRPWKSRLAIFYISNKGLLLDFLIIFLTILNSIKRKWALYLIYKILKRLNAEKTICNVVLRKNNLTPYAPPGTN